MTIQENELKNLLLRGEQTDSEEYAQKYLKNIGKTFYFICKRLASQSSNKAVSSRELNEFVIQELNSQNLKVPTHHINPIHWFSAEWTKSERGEISFFVEEYRLFLDRYRKNRIYYYQIKEPYFHIIKDIIKPPILETFRANDLGEPNAPIYRQHTIFRAIRDSQLAQKIKIQHNFTCQICSTKLLLPDNSAYAEAHHLQPLYEQGPDIESNMICVCPNCHALLDFYAIQIDEKKSNQLKKQGVHQKFIAFHNQKFAEEFTPKTHEIGKMNLISGSVKQMKKDSEQGRFEDDSGVVHS